MRRSLPRLALSVLISLLALGMGFPAGAQPLPGGVAVPQHEAEGAAVPQHEAGGVAVPGHEAGSAAVPQREDGGLAIASAAESPLPDSSSRPAGDALPASPRPPLLSFSPHPSDQCASFVILEASVNLVSGSTQDKMDQWLVTDGLGLMVNAGRWSLGGAAELHWARGHFDVAPSVRCRRWFAREQSLELSLGYVAAGPEWPRTRLAGPVASLRYSPTPLLFVQGGTCRFRETNAVLYDPQTGRLQAISRDFDRGYAGIGVAGAPGAAAWGVELAALGLAYLVIAAFVGMSGG